MSRWFEVLPPQNSNNLFCYLKITVYPYSCAVFYELQLL
jgi:hypothetical protein